jgi:ATP-dependent DNA helicase RecG
MTEPQTSLDLTSLAESYDLECKAAQGRDGRGEVPDDVWKTYTTLLSKI